MPDNLELIERSIRNVPDFPKKGIQFKDVSTLLNDPRAYQAAVTEMSHVACKKFRFDKIAGAESRGFLFAAPMALQTESPFVMVRKPGKLPGETVSQSYELEYGEDSIEVLEDSFSEGDRVLLVDDLLATGGTLEAMASLVEKCGAEVAGIVVLIELDGLGGRERLSGYPVESVLKLC